MSRRRLWQQIGLHLLMAPLAALWLLFLPNAPYILTDFKHLVPSPVVPLWADVVVIAAPAWTGMLLGFLSLYLVQSVLRSLAGPRVAWAAAVAVLGFKGIWKAVGKYLGSATNQQAEIAAGDQIALDQAAHYPVQPGPDAAGSAVRGEVVWDPRSSGGYLKLRGLPVNDPKREQYQLWVFDGTRDQRYPVDGGLFNVSKDGELELWIRVPIPVRNAAMFAVTVEQPGGTVVSDRGRIVALAKAGT